MISIIKTKYIGPSRVKGSRIKASSHEGSRFVPYDDAASSQENHRIAAMALAVKLGGKAYGDWSGVRADDGDGYIFINLNSTTVGFQSRNEA